MILEKRIYKIIGKLVDLAGEETQTVGSVM
jgi:hypothetical protein